MTLHSITCCTCILPIQMEGNAYKYRTEEKKYIYACKTRIEMNSF